MIFMYSKKPHAAKQLIIRFSLCLDDSDRNLLSCVLIMFMIYSFNSFDSLFFPLSFHDWLYFLEWLLFRMIYYII